MRKKLKHKLPAQAGLGLKFELGLLRISSFGFRCFFLRTFLDFPGAVNNLNP